MSASLNKAMVWDTLLGRVEQNRAFPTYKSALNRPSDDERQRIVIVERHGDSSISRAFAAGGYTYLPRREK